MLFSEPKIPQQGGRAGLWARAPVSVLFSEPKIPQSYFQNCFQNIKTTFQCSSASRKFLNVRPPPARSSQRVVSVLFSEPKIPQYYVAWLRFAWYVRFQCSSASRKFLNLYCLVHCRRSMNVSVLFSEPKIPQYVAQEHLSSDYVVSVLFSEPKIPQSRLRRRCVRMLTRFSALQRAENSSIVRISIEIDNARSVSVLFSEPKIPQSRNRRSGRDRYTVSVLFSEPKIPQSLGCSPWPSVLLCFSALQRAENSSISDESNSQNSIELFQCSSASRKFLNFRSTLLPPPAPAFQCSSASRKFLNHRALVQALVWPCLFQCSSASRKFLNLEYPHDSELYREVSVLFSEPKIPQLSVCGWRVTIVPVSVLFSEPKIPQYWHTNFINNTIFVSVLFSEPKIPQTKSDLKTDKFSFFVSVLFSEPKIPQSSGWRIVVCDERRFTRFSALQRAENSSMWHGRVLPRVCLAQFQCSSASRKFLNQKIPLCNR